MNTRMEWLRLICAANFAFLLVSAGMAESGTKRYVGLGSATSNWEIAENWDPVGAPTSDDTAFIPFSAPYVSITGGDCRAHTVIIENGGRLVVTKSSNGKTLTILRDLIVRAGGTFNTAGLPGGNGPEIYIGGNLVNDGLFDLSGVSSNKQGIIFNGVGTQYISGSGVLVFENITINPNDSLIVDATRIGILNKVTPTNRPELYAVNGGSFVIGQRPLSVTLESFGAVFDADSAGVITSWRTTDEQGNFGFYVERRIVGTATFDTAGFVAAVGPGYAYGLIDRGVTPGEWEYRLRQVDTVGWSQVYAPVSVTVGSVSSVAEPTLPAQLELGQNYPNPFNPATTITLRLPEATRVRLSVHSLLGQEVALLVDAVRGAGVHRVTFDGSRLPSGIYLYRLEAGRTTQTRRMVLLK